MAVRVRKNGKIVCAKMFQKRSGDLYIDDNLHYFLSVEKKVLIAEPYKKHKKTGRWYFITELPKGRILQIM